jgi:hypothetical protein
MPEMAVLAAVAMVRVQQEKAFTQAPHMLMPLDKGMTVGPLIGPAVRPLQLAVVVEQVALESMVPRTLVVMAASALSPRSQAFLPTTEAAAVEVPIQLEAKAGLEAEAQVV